MELELELELGLGLPKHKCKNNEAHAVGLKSMALPLLLEMQLQEDATHPNWTNVHDGRGSGNEEATKRKSMHVKVKMEGVTIGRKLDLRTCHSYHALTNTLIHMFANYSEIERNREDYTLMYQDKEGEWMVVNGDVRWEVFVESVQRVEIVKNDNRMGFRLLSVTTTT